MTTYKEIFGKPVKVLSSDPTDAGAVGQVWYNSTSGTFKSVVASGAWSSGAPTIEVYSYASSSVQGTQTASLCIGGYTTTASTTVEEYNGTAWTGSPA